MLSNWDWAPYLSRRSPEPEPWEVFLLTIFPKPSREETMNEGYHFHSPFLGLKLQLHALCFSVRIPLHC